MNTVDIQYTYNTQDKNNDNLTHITNIPMDENTLINKNTQNENKNIIPLRKRKSKKDRSDREYKKKKTLKCIYCATVLSDKYAFCPECGNSIPKNINKESLKIMKERYLELERSNLDLEKKLQLFKQREQIFEDVQRQHEKFTDLMWLVATIPKPQFNTEKIIMKDYTIRKISPAFSEFLGFQNNKPLINTKMSKILPQIPSQLSHIHSDYINDLSLKEDSVSYCKEEVFKNMYDELFLSNIQFTLYSNDHKPSLCIIVLTSIKKIDTLNHALPNLQSPYLESNDSQDN